MLVFCQDTRIPMYPSWSPTSWVALGSRVDRERLDGGLPRLLRALLVLFPVLDDVVFSTLSLRAIVTSWSGPFGPSTFPGFTLCTSLSSIHFVVPAAPFPSASWMRRRRSTFLITVPLVCAPLCRKTTTSPAEMGDAMVWALPVQTANRCESHWWRICILRGSCIQETEQTTLKFGAVCHEGVRRAWASTRRGDGLA